MTENLQIVSVYLPSNTNYNTSHINSKFKSLVDHYNNIENTIIAGDINAHNPIWESNHITDTRGDAFAEKFLDSNLIILNNGDHTYQSDSSVLTSAVDITLVHSHISYKFDWNKNFENLGSDHFILEINFNTKHTKFPNQTKTFINHKQILKDIQTLQISHIDTFNQYENELSGENKFIPKYWWNQTIKNLWIIKNQKMKLFNKFKTTYTKIEFKRCLAKLKNEIKKSKQMKFREFINEVNPDTDLKSIYKRINMFNDKKSKRQNINFNGYELKTFLETNYNNFNQNYAPIFPQYQNESITFEKISANEIKQIIAKNKNTTPGPNQISNKILKFLPKKDPEIILNNRPIALINSTTKLFNKTIKKKLDTHINEHKILPDNSFAFLKEKSAQECISCILSNIHTNKMNGDYTLIIATDITKAFDNVLNELKIKLDKINFNKYLTNMIHQFLYNRNYITNDKTSSMTVYDGLPQGSSLNATLFNIYTRKLHNIVDERCNLIQCQNPWCNTRQ